MKKINLLKINYLLLLSCSIAVSDSFLFYGSSSINLLRKKEVELTIKEGDKYTPSGLKLIKTGIPYGFEIGLGGFTGGSRRKHKRIVYYPSPKNQMPCYECPGSSGGSSDFAYLFSIVYRKSDHTLLNEVNITFNEFLISSNFISTIFEDIPFKPVGVISIGVGRNIVQCFNGDHLDCKTSKTSVIEIVFEGGAIIKNHLFITLNLNLSFLGKIIDISYQEKNMELFYSKGRAKIDLKLGYWIFSKKRSF